MFDTLLTVVDIGIGASLWWTLVVRGRLPRRMERVEKHLGLPPLVVTPEDKAA